MIDPFHSTIIILANGCGGGLLQLQHVAKDADPDVQQDLLLQLYERSRCYEVQLKAIA